MVCGIKKHRDFVKFDLHRHFDTLDRYVVWHVGSLNLQLTNHFPWAVIENNQPTHPPLPLVVEECA